MKKVQLISFSFYHEGKEYIIKARNQDEARALFLKLIK